MLRGDHLNGMSLLRGSTLKGDLFDHYVGALGRVE
jgi:hypothetical protein